MGKTLTTTLLFVLFVDFVFSATILYGHEDANKNKVKNWGFEQAISNNDWVCNGATCAKVNGGHTGSSAMRLTNRGSKEGGVRQKILAGANGLKKNTNYYMSAWIKFLNEGPASNPYIKVLGIVKVKTSTGEIVEHAGQLTYQLQTNEWVQVGQDMKMPNAAFDHVEYSLRVEPSSVNYLIDSVAFTEIPKYQNWKNHYNQEITKHRKNNVKITGSLRAGLDLSKTNIKVELQRHEFGFGMACNAMKFNGNSDLEQRYRNFILDTFNWGGFENDLKWKPMEGTKGNIKYGRVDTALSTMKSRNMTIRGHASLWAVKGTNPKWVQSLSGNALKTEMERRIDYYHQHYKGQIFEYDVYNEALHDHFFEKGLNNKHLMESIFKRVNRIDPKAELCLNDFQVARGGKYTSNNANLARHLLHKNVPLHCIGIQSHLKTLPIDPEVLEKRIAINADVGLPISITEFSAHSSNVNVRADGLETAFRVYFANPDVRSITLWGFGNQFGTGWSSSYYLFEGSNMTPNAAGNRFMDIVTKEWHTKKNYTPGGRSFSKTLLGFRGNYKLTVTTAGKVELEKDFYIGKGNNAVNFSV